MNDENQTPLTCTRVPENQRLDILPRYAGKHMMAVERLIYQAMREYCDDYQGGYWIMWELSNGAFYMAPGTHDEQFAMQCVGNYFNDTMSGDAAGIVACLVAFNRMAWATHEIRFSELFYRLRFWALEHPEATKIMAAID